MTRITAANRQAFLQGYASCLLWTGLVETENGDGKSLDYYAWQTSSPTWALKAFSVDDQLLIIDDCDTFLSANNEDVVAFAEDLGWNQAGHSFCLTRNGHGAGFWDRGTETVGGRLTEASQVFGQQRAYSANGDDQPHLY